MTGGALGWIRAAGAPPASFRGSAALPERAATGVVRCDNPLIDAIQAPTMAITLKNEHDIAQMRVACRLASEVLDYITPFVQAGVATGELDRLCHNYMVDVQGTVPAPLNYQPPGYPPYPKA